MNKDFDRWVNDMSGSIKDESKITSKKHKVDLVFPECSTSGKALAVDPDGGFIWVDAPNKPHSFKKWRQEYEGSFDTKEPTDD